MKELENKIEDAAKKQEFVLNGNLVTAWVNGAKSFEAKEYWQQGMYSEEDLRIAFNAGREQILSGYDDSGSSYKDKYYSFTEWFEQNKKK